MKAFFTMLKYTALRIASEGLIQINGLGICTLEKIIAYFMKCYK